MASPADVSEARHQLERELGVRADTAHRIGGFLEQRYFSQIGLASRTDLLQAASWAAQRLRQRFSAARLETVDLEEIAASLAEGCPLCGYFGGSSESSSTPVVSVSGRVGTSA